MGKHLWVKNLDDESHVKQPGCMWGLVHVLDYHHWQSNVRKMIHQRGYEHDKCNWSPDTSVHGRDGYEKLLDEQESPLHGAKRSRATKKRSLRARIKSIYTEETSRESEDAQGKGGGFSTKSSLQRTYSIHHLESVDDFFGKISTDWNHPIIFLPRNSEDHSSQLSDAAQMKDTDNLKASRRECNIHSPKEKPDVFEIFKVDKEFLLKQLQDSDESIANFSRSAFGLNTKGKFSKSRSFPVAELTQRRKLKPLKLESKQKEVWSFPRDDKVQTVHQSPGLDDSVHFGMRSGELAGDESNGVLGQGIMNKLDRQINGDVEPNKIANKSQPSESLNYREENNAVDRIGEKHDDDGIRKHTHHRSSSLNESLDKYARLFENSFGKDVKLSSSQSLRLTSEYGYAPLYFKRIRSLSNADSYYSDVNLEVLGENPSGASLVAIAEDTSSGLQHSEEEEVVGLVTSDEETVPLNENMEKEDDAMLHTSNEKCKNEDSLEDKADQLKESDSLWEKDADCSDITLEEVQDQSFVSDSYIFLHDTESPAVELHIPKGKEHESRIHKLNSPIDTDDLQRLLGVSLSRSQNLENYEIKEETRYPDKKNPDLDYVRHLLDRSGIAIDASEMPWHASNQLLSPQLFEEVEAAWPHEEDQLDGWPDFQGCWHHQKLFDLVNEVLLDVYDISLPYYPKALSSSCHVRPFPMGDRIIEEVCMRIDMLMNIKPEEESIDCIVARDLAHDRRWMNLQLESESIAIYDEDMIFDELLQEVIFS